MSAIIRSVRDYLKNTDKLLLFLCLAASVFGIVVISSATNYLGNTRYILVQCAALLLGLALFVLVSLADIDVFAEHWLFIMIVCALFIGTLFPFGTDIQGNKSWLSFSWLPFSIQPAELCKIPFILILAKIMQRQEQKPSSVLSVLRLAGITVFFFGLIMAVSHDLGVALQYLFIFLIMLFVGGVHLGWILGGLAAVVAASPLIWRFLGSYQQQRILVLFDDSVDPNGLTVRYHIKRSLQALKNGGLKGMGLFHGTMVQSGALPEQQNDFIFSSIGEELGLLGCIAVLLLLAAVIARIIWVGCHAESSLHRMTCFGIAGMLVSQVLINVGMCLGLFPVIGLTLPFFSYGGSSIVTMYLAMGVVAGISMRPAGEYEIYYIRPKRQTAF